MSSPYRQDAAAIRERREALARDLAETDTTLANLTTERGKLVRELEDLEKRLEHAPRSALDTLRVASPCSADWRKMTGDSRVRMCAECNKNVYDISAMTEAEALALLRRESGACVRFYKRADGRVMTSDCPVGVVDRRKRLRILAVASVPLVAATVAALGAASKAGHHTGQVVESVDPTPDLQQGARYNHHGYANGKPIGATAAAEVGVPERIPDAQLLEGDVPDPLPEPLQK